MKKKILKHIVVGFVFLLAYTAYTVCKWSVSIFGVGLDGIIFTLTSPLDGADNSTFISAVKECLPGIIIVLICYVLYAIFDLKLKKTLYMKLSFKKRKIELNATKIIRRSVAILSAVSLAASLVYANNKYDAVNYFLVSLDKTKIYEDYYVDPDKVNIKLANENQKYKNLLCIYLESMETTYTSVENGGNQDVCYIPNLVDLANKNISFSDCDKIGGFNCVGGSSYTMGALMALTSGVPFSFPGGVNSVIEKNFAGGITNLGDILKKNGYYQEFLCGSEAYFGGRESYFKRHGDYHIYDLIKARQDKYVPEDYFVWWGIEDKYLYQIAKDRLTLLSQKEEPFNFSMLTVDTHHIDGYVCDLCQNESDVQIANVISCADRQLAEFISWCETQSFFKDTVIVIVGDHPRMDTSLVSDIEDKDRTMYNCFINCDGKVDLNDKNRVFTTMDMFPTTLAALGFKWDGDRLGLGTNMFSNKKTIAEELGLEEFTSQLAKQSDYYVKNFR